MMKILQQDALAGSNVIAVEVTWGRRHFVRVNEASDAVDLDISWHVAGYWEGGRT